MIDNKPDFVTHKLFGKLYPECTWPISRIEDSGKFKGYIMPQIDFPSSATLGRFLNKKSRDVDGLTGFLGHRFTIAHNLALNVSKIHQRNHLIVDLKPHNILIQKQNYLFQYWIRMALQVCLKTERISQRNNLRQST